VVDNGGARQGVRELLQSILYKALKYLLQFCLYSEFKFWVPQFLGRVAHMVVGISGVGQGISDFLQMA